MNIHTVKKGETLRDIARLCPMGLQELLRANGLNGGTEPVPGQSLVIPGGRNAAAGSAQLLAFVSAPFSAAALKDGLPFFTYICPYAFSFSPGGELIAPEGLEFDSRLRDEGCAALLALANLDAGGSFSSTLAHSLLIDDTLQEHLLSGLLSRLRAGGYYGLQLCFNYLFPFDRDNYSSFAAKLSEKLHREGFLLSVELAPMEGAGRGSALCAGQDYETLGRAADMVSLMCCRWGHSFSPPRPLSPMPQLRDALDCALSRIPAEKLLMAVSGCGFDWKILWRQGTEARPLSNSAALALAGALAAEIEYDAVACAPHFDYTDPTGARHSVWFEDGRSMAEKLRLIGEYGLAGLSLCPADRVFQPLLELLQDMYTVEKLI